MADTAGTDSIGTALIITLFTNQKNLYDIQNFTLQWITLVFEILTAKLEQIAEIKNKKNSCQLFRKIWVCLALAVLVRTRNKSTSSWPVVFAQFSGTFTHALSY